MSEWRDNYVTYGLGCAAVWAAILVVGSRRLDAPEWRDLRIVCGGWWLGWTSATIARIVLAPPKPLTSVRASRLRTSSVVLVAVGIASVVRTLAAGRRHSTTPLDRRNGIGPSPTGRTW